MCNGNETWNMYKPIQYKRRAKKIFGDVSRFIRNSHSLISFKTIAIALMINKKQKKKPEKCSCHEPDSRFQK